MAVLFSATSVWFFGFNLSVDFKGGTVYEVVYSDKVPLLSEVKEAVKDSGLEISIIQKTGDDSFAIKVSYLPDGVKLRLREELTFDQQYIFEEKRIKTIGPTVSSELVTKSLFAILFVAIAIVLFIAIVFKGVSKPVSSFRYGLVAIVTLIHDIAIPTGIFAILGFFFINYQIDVLFVTALLAILGFSVNDTIVVFDRIRENLKISKEKNIKGEIFEKIVGKSLKQTIVRSVNTSLTTLVVLAALFIFGGEVIRPFALVLMLGVIVGTYSSIFVASPLLVYIERFQKDIKEDKREEKKKKEKEKKEFSEKEVSEALERLRAED